MHWRTTLGGILIAVGTVISKANGTLPSWVHLIGDCMEVSGPILLGSAACDRVVAVRDRVYDQTQVKQEISDAKATDNH